MPPTAKKNASILLPKTIPNLIAILIVASYGVTAFADNLRLAVPLLVGTSAVIACALAVLWYLGERGELEWSTLSILAVALLVRLPFMFSSPQLSDDIYRYLWDGLQMLRGTNPYAHPPSAFSAASPSLAALRALVNHPDLVTIYPPAAQAVFAAGAALGGKVLGMKVLLVLLDLFLCLLLIRLLDRWGLPRWRAVLYAWGPLPVLEIAGSGHVDGAGLLFLFLACALLPDGEDGRGTRWKSALCGSLLAVASLVKLFPLAFLPAFFLLAPRERRPAFSAGFLAAGVLLLIPFFSGLPNLVQTLKIYAGDWEFSGFLFNVVRRLTGSGTVARFTAGTAFAAFVALSSWRLARVRLPAKARALRSGPGAIDPAGLLLADYGYRISLCFLLLTPTLQPWYALSLAAFLPFVTGPAGFVLCWSVLLSYRVLIPYTLLGTWEESGWVTLVIFVAPVFAAGATSAWKAALNPAATPSR